MPKSRVEELVDLTVRLAARDLAKSLTVDTTPEFRVELMRHLLRRDIALRISLAEVLEAEKELQAIEAHWERRGKDINA